MSQVQRYTCEVCGVQERDHSNWLLVSDESRAHNIEIMKWDDKLAAQPGICHICCADHLQTLVGAWIMPDLGIPPRPAAEDSSSVLRNLEIDRLMSSSLPADRESLLAMLDAVEVVLKGAQVGDDDPAPVFDA